MSSTDELKNWLGQKWMSHFAYVFLQSGFTKPNDLLVCSNTEVRNILSLIDKPGHRLKARLLIDDLKAAHHGNTGTTMEHVRSVLEAQVSQKDIERESSFTPINTAFGIDDTDIYDASNSNLTSPVALPNNDMYNQIKPRNTQRQGSNWSNDKSTAHENRTSKLASGRDAIKNNARINDKSEDVNHLNAHRIDRETHTDVPWAINTTSKTALSKTKARSRKNEPHYDAYDASPPPKDFINNNQGNESSSLASSSPSSPLEFERAQIPPRARRLSRPKLFASNDTTAIDDMAHKPSKTLSSAHTSELEFAEHQYDSRRRRDKYNGEQSGGDSTRTQSFFVQKNINNMRSRVGSRQSNDAGHGRTRTSAEASDIAVNAANSKTKHVNAHTRQRSKAEHYRARQMAFDEDDDVDDDEINNRGILTRNETGDRSDRNTSGGGQANLNAFIMQNNVMQSDNEFDDIKSNESERNEYNDSHIAATTINYSSDSDEDGEFDALRTRASNPLRYEQNNDDDSEDRKKIRGQAEQGNFGVPTRDSSSRNISFIEDDDVDKSIDIECRNGLHTATNLKNTLLHDYLMLRLAQRGISGFTRRFCLLKSQGIFWYKREDDKFPSGNLNLKSVHVQLSLHSDAINVNSSKRAITLKFSNDVEASTWFDAMKEVRAQQTIHRTSTKSDRTTTSHHTKHRDSSSTTNEQSNSRAQSASSTRSTHTQHQPTNYTDNSVSTHYEKHSAAPTKATDIEVERAVDTLCLGIVLRSYKNGKPQTRIVWISDDIQHLHWGSDIATKPQQTIELSSIDALSLGAKSSKRDDSSFTIHCGQNTYEFEARTNEKRHQFMQALQIIIDSLIE